MNWEWLKRPIRHAVVATLRLLIHLLAIAPAPEHKQAGPQNSVKIVGLPVGRNARCPCKSGKKFKNCCERRGEYLTYQPPGHPGGKRPNGKTIG
jgi:hypothetical protein